MILIAENPVDSLVAVVLRVNDFQHYRLCLLFLDELTPRLQNCGSSELDIKSTTTPNTPKSGIKQWLTWNFTWFQFRKLKPASPNDEWSCMEKFFSLASPIVQHKEDCQNDLWECSRLWHEGARYSCGISHINCKICQAIIGQWWMHLMWYLHASLDLERNLSFYPLFTRGAWYWPCWLLRKKIVKLISLAVLSVVRWEQPP